MKKWLTMILLTLFLTGCAGQEAEQTTSTAETSFAPTTEPTGYYEPDSEMERRTEGAVRAYPLERELEDFFLFSGRPVLISGNGTLTLLEGNTGIPDKTLTLGQEMTAQDLTVYGDRAACYLEKERQVVIFNEHLQQVQQVTMPEEIMGSPVISLKKNTVYYCVPDQIRALNLETGLSALLRSHDSRSQTLMGGIFDGDILVCRMVSGQNQMGVLYLDSANGQTVGTETGISALYNRDDRYYVSRMDGMVRQQIFGTRDGEPQLLELDMASRSLFSALAMNAMVVDDGEILELYSLESGSKTAELDRKGLGDIVSADADEEAFWFLGRQSSGDTLYRWEPGRTPVAEQPSLIGPLYTASNPDTQGLAQCQERVKKMNKDYGVKIRIWQEAVEVDGGFPMVPEYQVAAINRMLDTVDDVFSQFPDWFLATSIRAGRICVDIVRSVEAPCPGLQFWDGRYGHIVLTTSGDAEQELLLGLGSIIDSHVLGNSRELDKWNEKQNPEGFVYDGSYQLNAQRTDVSLTEGEDPVFLNQISMAFPTEERRQIFCYAMGRENRFTTPTLQKKLTVLCEGIREAYDLDKRSESFLWEQYLQTPLAADK